jgi:hypothetical protein
MQFYSKEAANKVLNSILGNDPRWMRPKTWDEARKRLKYLKRSERARKRGGSRNSGPQMLDFQQPLPDSRHYSELLDREDVGDRLPTSSSSSTMRGLYTLEAKVDWTSESAAVDFAASVPRSLPTAHDAVYELARDYAQDRQDCFPPQSPSRQGTNMTESTDFTTGSWRDEFLEMEGKAKDISPDCEDNVKDLFRLFRKFTRCEGHGNPRETSDSPETLTPRASELPISYGSTARTIQPDQDQLAGSLAKVEAFLGRRDALKTEDCEFALNPFSVDDYGNTTYHYLAAAAEPHSTLISYVQAGLQPLEQRQILMQNRSGQTMLHVLHSSWFSRDSNLEELLSLLRRIDFDFYASDVYGRTFFHILWAKLDKDQPRLRKLTGGFDSTRYDRRDAFGLKPAGGNTRPMSSLPAEQSIRLTIPSTGPHATLLRQAELLRLVVRACSGPDPTIEDDPTGGNGLHALAEVRLRQFGVEDSKKRKMGDHDGPLDDEANSVAVPLEKRLEYLDTLLDANVDASHYNGEGDTVLMAFISKIVDGDDDKSLEKIIQRLVGAGANINARNRKGETALHIAVRHGRKFPVKVLLGLGANPYARDHLGCGVLAYADRIYVGTERDRFLNGRLEACRAILTTDRFTRTPARQHPSAEDEWSWSPPQSARSPSKSPLL